MAMIFYLGFLATLAGAQDYTKIIQEADRIRNPDDSFVMKVEVKNSGDDGASAFEVYTKGTDKTLIKTLAPKRDLGRDLLMVEENMWAYVPNLKRSVRVSLNQKLSGQAANGDISRMRWAGDYDVALEKEEKKQWVLKLIAKKKGLTYERIRAVIEKSSGRPVSAEYLSLSDQVLKKARFLDYRNLAGRERPSKIEIIDAKNSNQGSEIIITDMKTQSIPDSYFQTNRLGSI